VKIWYSKMCDLSSTAYFGDMADMEGWASIITLKTGDALFLPGGVPHIVFTERDTLAVGTNYLQLSRLEYAVSQYLYERETKANRIHRMPGFCVLAMLVAHVAPDRLGHVLQELFRSSHYRIAPSLENIFHLNVEHFLRQEERSKYLDNIVKVGNVVIIPLFRIDKCRSKTLSKFTKFITLFF
jgi:hypothetical protein